MTARVYLRNQKRPNPNRMAKKQQTLFFIKKKE